MKKTEILKRIAEVMNNDAACCKDKKDEALQRYESLIKEEMSENEFLLTVNSYLSTFELTGHLFFKKQGQKELPFRVQRYGDVLYVTAARKDSALSIGDKVTEINGRSVKEFYEKYAENFFREEQERQTPHWNFILKFADRIGYVKKSEETVVYWDVELLDRDGKKTPYIFQRINESVSYLRIENFADSDGISLLLKENDAELRAAKILLIDVRGNEGGNSVSYDPLLKYCLPNGKRLCDLALSDDGVLRYGQEILYSERNCDVRIEIIEGLMQKNLSKHEETVFEQALRELRNLRGKGFVKVTETEDSDIMGDSDVEHVYILTDSSCCSAGDAFVYLFGRLPKVKVFGRPTQGILDYSNVAYALFGEYALVYPTSRLLSLDYGEGMMRKGVPVDEYIPWKPEHLERDADLEYVLKLL